MNDKKYKIEWADRNGLARIAKFETIDAAQAVASEIFEKTGVIVGIEAIWRIRPMSIEEKYGLITQKVTLNGLPAVISGARLPMAVVSALDGAAAYEFTWHAVERIVSSGGRFEV